MIDTGVFEYDHNKVYIILGSVRSGTSFLAEALERMGVDMGQYNNKRYNINKENQELVKLNKKILREAGGDEFDIPKPKEIGEVIPKFEDEIKEFVEKYHKPFWGFKDPRCALTIEHFLPHISGDVYLIYTDRDTTEAARSLATHEDIDFEDAKRVIQTYKARILQILMKRL